MRSDVVAFCLIGCWGWACGFSTTLALDASGGDAGSDGGSGSCTSFSLQLDTCGLTFNDLTLTQNTTFNTDTGELTPPPAGEYITQDFNTLDARVRAIVARNVTIDDGVELRATGTLPFAIVASGTVTIRTGADINVSDGGAGALAVCSTPAMVGGTDTDGGGGGGGGGFGRGGGDGGRGGDNQATGGTGSSSITAPLGPRGGCPGARGGAGSNDASGGPGGSGGGAIYIVAKDGIELGDGATINAGGGGGRGGTKGAVPSDSGGGGGGGGAGGTIWLEAPRVVGLQATIAANGGGGGEGGDDLFDGDNGDPGGGSSSRAPGGTGIASNGADGGRGGSREGPDGENVGSSPPRGGGGGGGGGGVGYIHIVTTIEANVRTTSPMPHVPP